MRMRLHKFKSESILSGTLLMIFFSGGCVNDYGDCTESPSKEERFNLQFSISTAANPNLTRAESDLGSRAADTDGEVRGSAAENYINVDGGDLMFLLFDGNRRFLQQLPLSDVKTVYTASDYKEYIFHTPVTAQYFKDNIDKTFSFYIMVLANGRSMGMTYPAPSEGQTIQEIVEERLGNVAANLLTTQPNTYSLMNIDSWAPQCFPMAGLQKFTVSGPELKKGTEAIPYNISANGKDINMLRALTKIEVIDHVNFEGKYNESIYGNDENRIDKVEINGFMNAGSIIPAIGQWTNEDADETQQVESPSTPSGASYMNPVPMTSENSKENHIIDFSYDQYASQLNEDGCNVFSIYLYEYDRGKLTNSQQVPYIRVTTKGKPSDNDAEGSHVLPMALAAYTDGIAGEPVASLLRNHIYRYQINAINNEANLTVTWTVCPMDQVDINIPDFN